MDFPKSCVLYLRSGKNTPDFLEIEMVLSDEKIVHYWVPTMKLETYTRNSIFEKNLLMLLPFYIMRYEKDIHEMSENPEMFQSLLNDYEEIRINLERELSGADKTALYMNLNKLKRKIQLSLEKNVGYSGRKIIRSTNNKQHLALKWPI